MKKSVILTLLAFAVFCGLSACGSTDTKVNSNYGENGKPTKPQHPVCVVTQKELITDNAFKAMVRGKAQLVEMLRFKVQAMIDEKYPRLNKLDDRLSNMIAPLSKEEKEALDFKEDEFRKAIEVELQYYKGDSKEGEEVSKEESGKEQVEQQPIAENEKKVSEGEFRSKVEEEFNRDKGFFADDTESSYDHKDKYIDIARYVAEHSSSGLETMEKWADNILMCVELEKFEESADAYLKQIENLIPAEKYYDERRIDFKEEMFRKLEKEFDKKIVPEEKTKKIVPEKKTEEK